MCLFSSVDGHLGGFYLLAIVSSANIDVKSLSKPCFQFFVCLNPEMELLDHMVILCLVSWGITILFSSIVASWFYIPTNFSTLANICFILLLLTILMGAGCDLTVVLICISLMINGVEQLFVCSLAICLSSLNKYLFKSFAYFQIAGFLLLSLKSYPYILDIILSTY